MSRQNTSNTPAHPTPIHTAVILAAGDFPRREEVLRLLDEADLVACCDSAAATLVKTEREPGLIVGDLDSIPAELQVRYADRMVQCSGQDDNDLTKTFHEVIKLKPSVIHILGATGLREDHTLGNISLLMDYQLEAGDCPVDIVSDYGRFVAARGRHTFHSEPGQEISIFAFDNSLQMKAEGLEYSLDGVTFNSLWKATLNKATGSEFTLTPNSNAPYLVYLCNPGL